MSSIEPAQASDRKQGLLESTANFQANVGPPGNNNPYIDHPAGLRAEKENALACGYRQEPAHVGKGEYESGHQLHQEQIHEQDGGAMDQEEAEDEDLFPQFTVGSLVDAATG